MPMASAAVPLEIIDDDDDEFDWEAAVREIDVACEATKPSTSCSSGPPRPLSFKNKTAGACRQITLDRFVGAAAKRPLPEKVSPGSSDPFDLSGVERPTSVIIDPEAAKTWIYPVNFPVRDYQLSITKTALFSNTLVALPTGLGKTLIAAVVMYNYFRWFPEGKIVFMAPSRPLVLQQIEACHTIVGIPQDWTIDMTGKRRAVDRADYWKTKRVFFVTPQVLEKDIHSGTCPVKYLTCLVVDEAHRASGNFSYCVAVRELMAVRVKLRILALTATPGSQKQTIQHVIDNLHISTIEYRDESDQDVIPYVHNRMIELIQVELGQDADRINNLLSKVIQAFLDKLFQFGLLQKRDIQTYSPLDFIKLKEKCHSATPQELPHKKFGDIQGWIYAIIPLYHIRKLLLVHGIKPAFEMLEKKLKKGPFESYMRKYSTFWEMRDLMKSLSDGVQSPKLSKLLEVLINHFKTNDPKISRVIIFSNYRGSVSNILAALAKIGDQVKPTAFIGQSSGKASKGQSQKDQQAVLKNFRAGVYNVIVATSIGEEGLDIMDVDLVICFDANISPLRMIQRMGRTGRKHDGRVVVLACEGTELRGYIKKQGRTKAVRKLLVCGGLKSFNFHPSPRMIPHMYKPEAQFVEMSIRQYIPHGRNSKDPPQTSILMEKLTNEENELLAKFFHPDKGNSWRPSLIAFPHFQAFPSRVHNVLHSYRTGMLIDAMKQMYGLSLARDSRSFSFEDQAPFNLPVEAIDKHDNGRDGGRIDSLKGLRRDNSLPKLHIKSDVNSEVSFSEFSKAKDGCHFSSNRVQDPSVHAYLYGTDFVSVDALGEVLILSVPLLPIRNCSNSKCASSIESLSHLKHNSCNLMTSLGAFREQSAELAPCNYALCKNCKAVGLPRSSNCDPWKVQRISFAEKIRQSPVSKKDFQEQEYSARENPAVGMEGPMILADECCNGSKDPELSPRLTNLIESGVVPESPTNDGDVKGGRGYFVPDLDLQRSLCTDPVLETECLGKNKEVSRWSGANDKDVLDSPINVEFQTPVKSKSCREASNSESASLTKATSIPRMELSNSSSSNNWHLSSEEKFDNVKQAHKFKRLRKQGDSKQGNVLEHVDFTRSLPSIKDKRKGKDVRVYIEEEAEVSSEAEVSTDEEDGSESGPYDDSFLDDRINATEASTQAEVNTVDMMAIYRRSLLSQSPVGRPSKCTSDITPVSLASVTKMSGSGSNSDTIMSSLQSGQVRQLNPDRTLSSVIPSSVIGFPSENKMTIEGRKRKLSSRHVASVPSCNLEEEFSLHSEAACKELFLSDDAVKIKKNCSVFDDDQFYQGLDLDELEAQATMLLRSKLEFSTKKADVIQQSGMQNFGLSGSPSFDLGI